MVKRATAPLVRCMNLCENTQGLAFHFLQFPELLNLLGLTYFLISSSVVADPELIDRQAEENSMSSCCILLVFSFHKSM